MSLGKRKNHAAFGATSKRRRVIAPVQEISFDPSAREEYLTGFHKRKLQRQTRAKAEAEKKEREAKIALRKQVREERKAQVEKHVAAVNAAIEEADGKGGEESGSKPDNAALETPKTTLDPEPALDFEDEYIDESKYTTVTVETVDVSREGLHKAELEQDDEPAKIEVEDKSKHPDRSDRNAKAKRPKRRKEKFRYESKKSRLWTREKEKWRKKMRAINKR